MGGLVGVLGGGGRVGGWMRQTSWLDCRNEVLLCRVGLRGCRLGDRGAAGGSPSLLACCLGDTPLHHSLQDGLRFASFIILTHLILIIMP